MTRFYRRRFLNRPRHHAGAHVIADCEVLTHKKETWVSASLKVADCYRVADLDFSAHDKDALRNALHKAHALQKVVNDFTAALEAAASEMRGRLRE